MEPVEVWAEAFMLTLLIETPVYVWGMGPLRGRWVLGSVGINSVTHPALWYVVPRFLPWELWVAVAEVGVWATEALLLTALAARWGAPRELAARRAAAVALVANGLSTLIGLLR